MTHLTNFTNKDPKSFILHANNATLEFIEHIRDSKY